MGSSQGFRAIIGGSWARIGGYGVEIRGYLVNKAGYTNQLKSRVLGRSSNMEGMGSGESRIHDSISRV